ncbi:MAG: hypothetical protein JST92_23520 [Deltaproteobacteria bacterium]|nr:hypothetical protein [Deltaproteobacteria bacterium]
MKPIRVLALSVLSVSLASCIERPAPESPSRPAVDRSRLQDVLVRQTPPNLTPVGATFGNGAIELVGYTADPSPMVPGQHTRVVLYWRCRSELDSWHIFVHLDDVTGSGERIHAEHDPAGGRYPTDAWQPGDLIADSFAFAPGHAPLGLYLGLYSQGETRLKLDQPGRGKNDGGNRLLAGILPMVK